MTTIDVETLITTQTEAEIFDRALEVAQAAELPVSSWRVGDPTRTTFAFLAEVLGTSLEPSVVEHAKAAWLSKASGAWLTVLAAEVYGVTRTPEQPSTPSVTVQNTGGGLYDEAAGDVTFKCAATGVTFHTTEALYLPPGGTATVALVADVDGSAGTVAVDDVDTLVTPLLGVVIGSSTAAVGTDEQSDAALKIACADTLGALSPNGPPDAYEYVAKNSTLTTTTAVTRARSTHDDDLFRVTVYVAGPAGAVTAPVVALVQTAIAAWATPLCVRPTAVSATNKTVNVVASLSGTGIPDDAEARVSATLGALLAAYRIAGQGGGTLPRSVIFAAFHTALSTVADLAVTLTTPAADVTYAEGYVPALGTCTVT